MTNEQKQIIDVYEQMVKQMNWIERNSDEPIREKHSIVYITKDKKVCSQCTHHWIPESASLISHIDLCKLYPKFAMDMEEAPTHGCDSWKQRKKNQKKVN